MQTKQLSPDLAVSQQLQLEDIPALARDGVLSIICNRPDEEGPDHPSFSQIEQEAARFGMTARYLPAAPDNITDAHVAEFGQLMDELPKPIVGYCRTGRRSTSMWALSRAGKQSPAELLEAASQAGYDLGALAPRLEKN
ncbi:TIGR01244 family sulfur transferase [Massilia sp. H6]|uniref:TIGR01244 family sulfur transferase n=1 Tax=Massilia sp. H6 TaxID=2970464 RepID=UPI0021698A59|nr:TIGR01244 family sulfur transferase [Massilia sp. H6]UVW26989.1 TIGR01244 family sulfur transferase [Massilia sp. H6]